MASEGAKLELIVTHFFEQRLGEAAQDQAIYEYVAGALTDSDSDNLEELRDVVKGFSPRFSSFQKGDQEQALLELIAEIKAAACDAGPQLCAPAPGGTAAVDVARPAAASCLQQLRSMSLGSQPEEPEPACPAAGAADAEAIAVLQGLCEPPLLEGFLCSLLAKCSSDIQAAAAYLLDSADLTAEQRAWEGAEARRRLELEQAEVAKKCNRQKILEKFQLEAVVEPRAGKPQQVSAWAAKDGNNNSKVRFRDGHLVTTKGDKYIVEKVGEDWDGGSRGKVITKGKRGKGFV